jgi:hypothetical protein
MGGGGGGGVLGGAAGSLVGSAVLGPVGGIIGGAAGGGESMLGDITEPLTGARATQRAIDAQMQAAREGNATQKYMYDQTRADNQPWRDAGVKALGDLSNPDFQKDFTMADFQADPGYQFRMAEGAKALERSAAARGSLMGGGFAKAISRYGQDVASQEYGNAYNRFNADRDRRFNRLGTLAGIGQTAQGQNAQAGQNYANNVSQTQIGMGNAIASAQMGQANRMSGLIGQGIQGGAMILACDERLKENINPVSREDLDEIRSMLKPYVYNYKGGPTSDLWVGIMADDLEKSKLGKTCVFTDSDGFKKVNGSKLLSLFFASIAEVA